MGDSTPLKRALLTPFVRWYARSQLPRFGHLLEWYGVNDQSRWLEAPVVEVRGRRGDERHRLDLSDSYHRLAYFMGCYHELDVLSTVGALLRPGDEFVDGGANIGLLTLYAARIIDDGVIHAYEPNPEVFEQLRWHMESNGIANVKLHRAGLSDADATGRIRIPVMHNTGAGTIGPLPTCYGYEVRDLGEVATVRIDDQIDQNDPRPLTIKLDIEGYEMRALHGMRRTIERRRPALLLELNVEMLTLNETSADEVCSWIGALGYRRYDLDRRGRRGRRALWLHPSTSTDGYVFKDDVLWVHPDSPHHNRIQSHVLR